MKKRYTLLAVFMCAVGTYAQQSPRAPKKLRTEPDGTEVYQGQGVEEVQVRQEVNTERVALRLEDMTLPELQERSAIIGLKITKLIDEDGSAEQLALYREQKQAVDDRILQIANHN